MSLKFDDIMKKFYDDPSLGIKTEDAPTNNAGSGAVSMPPDAAMKKKKKNPYDGRTKEARQFYKRMETLRARRESRLAKKVQENTIEQASYFAESNLDVLKKIVKDKQHQNVKFKDGNMKVDLFTASAVTQVYDKVNRSNQQKMDKMLNGKKAEFMKIANFALSKVK
jgi:DNA-binding transcriptional MocR family regulator